MEGKKERGACHPKPKGDEFAYNSNLGQVKEYVCSHHTTMRTDRFMNEKRNFICNECIDAFDLTVNKKIAPMV